MQDDMEKGRPMQIIRGVGVATPITPLTRGLGITARVRPSSFAVTSIKENKSK